MKGLKGKPSLLLIIIIILLNTLFHYAHYLDCTVTSYTETQLTLTRLPKPLPKQLPTNGSCGMRFTMLHAVR